MATKKRKLKKEEKEVIDLVAREMVVDSVAEELAEENRSAQPNAEENPISTVEFTPAKQTELESEQVPEVVEAVTPKENEEVAPKTKEEIVERIAVERYNEYIESEKALVEKQLENVKNAHKTDYDAYIEMLKGTDYYKECVEKWKKYYQEKRDEITAEVEKEVEEMVDAEARNEAVGLTPKAVETPKPTPTPKTKIVINEIPEDEELKHKISTAVLNIDPELRKTVEQIVLTSLYDSFDASKDRYSAELTELEKTRTGPLKAKYKEMVDFRWQLSGELVNSFTKIFDTTKNKTVLNPSSVKLRELQTDLARNKGDMDVGLVADMIFDKLYHKDLKSGEVSGVVSDLVDYLTIRVQEELLKVGQLDFNLYKEACKKIVNKVLIESGLAVKIVENEKITNEKSNFLALLGEELKSLKNNIKNGTFDIEDVKLIDSLKVQKEKFEKEGIKFNDDQSKIIDTELSQSLYIAKRLLKLYDVADEDKKKAETKKLLNNLNVSQIAVVDLIREVKGETKLDKKSLEAYETDNVKKLVGTDGKISTKIARDKGLRPITDYLVMKLLEVAGAENAKGKLKEFDLAEDKTTTLTFNLISALEEEREPSVDVTVSILEQIILLEHDLRESVKSEPEKFDAVQEKINAVTELKNTLQSEEIAGTVKDHKKEIEKVLNDFIEISNTKEYGKARKKVGLLEEVETK